MAVPGCLSRLAQTTSRAPVRRGPGWPLGSSAEPAAHAVAYVDAAGVLVAASAGHVTTVRAEGCGGDVWRGLRGSSALPTRALTAAFVGSRGVLVAPSADHGRSGCATGRGGGLWRGLPGSSVAPAALAAVFVCVGGVVVGPCADHAACTCAMGRSWGGAGWPLNSSAEPATTPRCPWALLGRSSCPPQTTPRSTVQRILARVVGGGYGGRLVPLQ